MSATHLRLAVRQLALEAEVQRPEAAREAGPQRCNGARGGRVPRSQRQVLQAGRPLRYPLACLEVRRRIKVSTPVTRNC
jgi:hypothetical protein